ncbi:MAG TPA: tRNA lysidine(34) synthetase TilS [Polyangiaceae bacterium]|nr:tRNA lysidine(34) synthetase TilS [Polyangiaceae bacterium]
MRSSHPPALLKIVARTIADEHLFRAGDRVLVAVSGGPDSMALLHVLSRLAPKLRLGLRACGVNHGLRLGAADELMLAERFAADLGVPFTSTKLDLAPGPNLMARARDARFAALRGILDAWEAQQPAVLAREDGARAPIASIATGHHADDRAETVLIRLLRGSGPTGLGVLTPRAPKLTRPLVRARRADIMAHLERHRVPFAEDPSNRDPRFLRTRVRGEVLPLLSELSPRIVEHLCALADAAAALGPRADGDVPAVLEGVALGRAQRASLARALSAGNRRARVPISGGKVAGIDLTSRRIVVMKAR